MRAQWSFEVVIHRRSTTVIWFFSLCSLFGFGAQGFQESWENQRGQWTPFIELNCAGGDSRLCRSACGQGSLCKKLQSQCETCWDGSSPLIYALVVQPEFAESLSVKSRLLAADLGRLWGRDLITVHPGSLLAEVYQANERLEDTLLRLCTSTGSWSGSGFGVRNRTQGTGAPSLSAGLVLPIEGRKPTGEIFLRCGNAVFEVLGFE